MIPTDVEPGTRISEYILIEQIGRGGFAEVWKARHHVWNDKIVAIKIPLDSDFVKQLKLEGVIQHRLRHPNIVETYGLDPYSDPPYFVMEYVDGESLRQWLKRVGRLTSDETRRVSIQILQGLKHAHNQGIIHRDIKPSNILITKEGQVKLSDFGLGRAVELTASSLLYSNSLQTSNGTSISGTLSYMSPEQKEPGREIDQRSDIYSFGLVFFEMLTGELPQGGEVPSDLNPTVPRQLDDVFNKCYTRIENRFASAQEVINKLSSSKVGSVYGKRPSGIVVNDSYITFEEVMGLLGATRKELHDLIVEGKINTFRVRDKVRFRRGQILMLKDQILEKQGTTSAPRVSVESAESTITAFRSVGFFARTFARFFDWFVIAAITYFSVAALIYRDSCCTNPNCDFQGHTIFYVFSQIKNLGHYLVHHLGALVIGFLSMNVIYFTLMTAIFGTTFGKALIGARVVKPSGKHVGFFSSLLRVFGTVISWMTMGVGFVTAGFNPKKQALHDLIANTRVIYEPDQRRRSTMAIMVLLLTLAFVALVVWSCRMYASTF